MERFAWLGFAVWSVVLSAAPASAQPLSGLNLSINCPSGRPMSIPSTVKPAIYATVITFLSKAEARQQLLTRELTSGEQIDPIYANDQRVIVEWKMAPGGFVRTFATVPSGMTIRIGEEVSFILSHTDQDNLCFYVPNLIVP